MRGSKALDFVTSLEPSTCLDVGSGSGAHAEILSSKGWNVTTVSYIPPADYVGDFLSIPFDSQFQVVWASHVLEHQRNVGLFLDRCYDLTAEGGWFCVTVPPLKQQIVGGHITLWNMGLLLYNLVLSGFDCRYAKCLKYGYNLSVCVQKTDRVDTSNLEYDSGDLAKLKQYFPFGFHMDSFDGDIGDIN